MTNVQENYKIFLSTLSQNELYKEWKQLFFQRRGSEKLRLEKIKLVKEEMRRRDREI
jgi:hypothetical protein